MFKVGDKVKWKFKHRDYWCPVVYVVQDKHPEDFTPKGTLIGVEYDDKGLHRGYIRFDNPDVEYKLVEEKKEMTHKYNEGQWYAWDGKSACPLHPEDEITTVELDGSKNGYHNSNPKRAVYTHSFSKVSRLHNLWSWAVGPNKEDKAIYGGGAVVAFYITKKYQETVEMTVEEICKALGKNIKVVK